MVVTGIICFFAGKLKKYIGKVPKLGHGLESGQKFQCIFKLVKIHNF